MAKFNFIFTFEPDFSTKVVNKTEDAECFYQVMSTNYPAALNKVLKLKLPNITSESDLNLVSVQEEAVMEVRGNDEGEIEIEN